MQLHRNNIAALLATGIVVSAMDAGPVIAIASMASAPPGVAVPASYSPPAQIDSNHRAIPTVELVRGSAIERGATDDRQN
jgi:hypothetical protein